MRQIVFLFLMVLMVSNCQKKEKTGTLQQPQDMAREVVEETFRTWQSYRQYAWGHDVLRPLTKSYQDWYAEPLYISPIDAYSTLHLMGLTEETRRIEKYVVDSLDFDKDIDAKIFEVNIRILGGLLAMYEHSRNEQVLDKARNFANRMLPAFDTKTGIPKYWVNLKTGKARGDTVNVAEAGTYTFEMGLLSYYTKDAKYYQAAKRATLAIYKRYSGLGLPGDVIDVESGEWVSSSSHICAGVDSYYEYLYKSFLMFGDPDLGQIWEKSVAKIHQYIAEEHDGKLWYGRVDMHTGKHISASITLYDAFFPAILALSGDIDRAKRLQETWNWLWNSFGLEPMVYNYKTGQPTYPAYDLNPEIIESAYYLYHLTGDKKYLKMNIKFWEDIKKYCKTDGGFASIEDVRTMKQKDYMPTFFFAETLKYLYLTFTHDQGKFDFDDHLFNTEAHHFKKSNFDYPEAKIRLGY
ncbi:MAG: glycoside hydrolase family 47 protein [Candidatus Marinimicrobia bacterium]|nr:glycoside hydrolase family 47 protein [Candidatus Neomarinimicrobiota bacterium]